MRQQIEYTAVILQGCRSDSERLAELNKLGRDGWVVISMIAKPTPTHIAQMSGVDITVWLRRPFQLAGADEHTPHLTKAP